MLTSGRSNSAWEFDEGPPLELGGPGSDGRRLGRLIGRAGRQWAGRAVISGKHVRPAWAPPPDIAREHPGMAKVYPGGAPNNPMGVAAMTLSGGDYAIHGTNNPGSIGGFVSYGCIRMYNADVLDLYNRVGWGTTVVVTR